MYQENLAYQDTAKLKEVLVAENKSWGYNRFFVNNFLKILKEEGVKTTLLSDVRKDVEWGKCIPYEGNFGVNTMYVRDIGFIVRRHFFISSLPDDLYGELRINVYKYAKNGLSDISEISESDIDGGGIISNKDSIVLSQPSKLIDELEEETGKRVLVFSNLPYNHLDTIMNFIDDGNFLVSYAGARKACEIAFYPFDLDSLYNLKNLLDVNFFYFQREENWWYNTIKSAMGNFLNLYNGKIISPTWMDISKKDGKLYGFRNRELKAPSGIRDAEKELENIIKDVGADVIFVNAGPILLGWGEKGAGLRCSTFPLLRV